MKLKGDQLLVWRLPGLWSLCLRSHRRQRCASGAGREEGGLTVLLQVCPYVQGMWGRCNCSEGGKQAGRSETRASRANSTRQRERSAGASKAGSGGGMCRARKQHECTGKGPTGDRGPVARHCNAGQLGQRFRCNICRCVACRCAACRCAALMPCLPPSRCHWVRRWLRLLLLRAQQSQILPASTAPAQPLAWLPAGLHQAPWHQCYSLLRSGPQHIAASRSCSWALQLPDAVVSRVRLGAAASARRAAVRAAARAAAWSLPPAVLPVGAGAWACSASQTVCQLHST
jgi:hypothetical protein